MKISTKTSDILDAPYKHSEHKVRWSLIKTTTTLKLNKRWKNTEAKELATKSDEDVCYGQFRRVLLEGKYTHMFTSIPVDKMSRDLLTTAEMITWLTLAKKNKLLPHYVTPTKIVDKGSCLNAMFNLKTVKNKQQLYVYLTIIRHIQEDPGFVKVVLYLVKNLKLDYFNALSVGSYHGVRYDGHHIMPIRSPYPAPIKVAKATYDLKYSRALKLFVKDPKKYGDKKLYIEGFWNMTDTLKSIKIKSLKVIFNDLDAEKTSKFINKGF